MSDYFWSHQKFQTDSKSIFKTGDKKIINFSLLTENQKNTEKLQLRQNLSLCGNQGSNITCSLMECKLKQTKLSLFYTKFCMLNILIESRQTKHSIILDHYKQN